MRGENMKKALKAVFGTVGGIAGYLVLTAGAYLPFVVADAKKNYRDDCDYLMVLGGNVFGADTPSPQLLERMKAAAAYCKENEKCFIVPCGGCFRPEQKKSEAQIIASYLVEQGIDEGRIVLEDKSTTTYENFEFALEIIKNHSGKPVNENKIAFLSSDYHIHRASIIAKRCGLENPYRVSCPTPKEAWKRYAREYIVAYELLKPYKK